MKTPIRVVIVDDEKPGRDRVRRLLEDHPDFVIAGEAGDVPSAIALVDRVRPALCFLDVQMPAGDGFDVLRRVRHVPRVIFTTAHDQYAVRAFDVNSVDYLLKPFSPRRFAAALEKAREKIASEAPPGTEIVRLLEEIRPPTRIPARKGARIVLLDPSQVLWFEAEETLVFARTEEGRSLVERSLSELEIQLAAFFFRTHRRYLVNLSRIAEIRPADAGTCRIVLRDAGGTILPLSRRQARRLRERIPW